MVLPAVTTLDEAKSVIRNLAEELERLGNEVAWFKRQIFGAKSERFLPDSDETPTAAGL